MSKVKQSYLSLFCCAGIPSGIPFFVCLNTIFEGYFLMKANKFCRIGAFLLALILTLGILSQ